jgi:dolichol kinase
MFILGQYRPLTWRIRMGILVALLAIFVSYFDFEEHYHHADNLLDFIVMSFPVLVFAVFMVGLGVSIAGLIGMFLPKEWNKVSEKKLISLRNESGASGYFILGTGAANHNMVYHYHVVVSEQDDVRSFKAESVTNGDNVTIVEEKREDAILITSTPDFTSEWSWLIAMPTGSNRYEFRVPRETVVRQFKLH